MRLIDVRKIWDRAPHNGMTDLVRFQGRWFCVFREGEAHVSPDGKVRIIASADGIAWEEAELISIPGLDLRDPKITLMPSGGLMLTAAGASEPSAAVTHRTFAFFSGNGFEWSAPRQIGDPNFWLWRVTWNEGVAYSVAYSTAEPLCVRLYSSANGTDYRVLSQKLFIEDFPNEASLAFQKDGSALCLLRRDSGSATAKLGRSFPDYADWRWIDVGVRIGGPSMLLLNDGRMVAAVRRYGEQPWTSLNWLDPERGTLTEFMALPSGGDTGYAGLQSHEGVLWVSYYSSHEQRTSVYLARIEP